MRRTRAKTLAVALVALVVVACAEDKRVDDQGGVDNSGCRAYTTCGACTPVPGCGWCQPAGQGYCVDDPDDCDSNLEFNWTWEPAGCPRVAPDASALLPDAVAPEAAAPEAAPRDAASAD
jgi:hypothetical protein